MEPVRVIPLDGPTPGREDRSNNSIAYHRLTTPLRTGILRARQFLLNQQQDSGFWCANQQGDASLPSQLILWLTYLGHDDSELVDRAAQCIVDCRLPTGGWSTFPDGPVDVTVSVQAYFALKLAGHDPSDSVMRDGRQAICGAGGADRVDTPTRFLLALLGQIGYDHCLPMPPERVQGAAWMRRYQHAAWSHLALPLSIVWAHRPSRPIDPRCGIRELFLEEPDRWSYAPDVSSPEATDTDTWAGRWERTGCKWSLWTERIGCTPRRNRALRQAEVLLISRVNDLANDEAGLSETVWLSAALHALGYCPESQEMRRCRARIVELFDTSDPDRITHPRPNSSTLQDTAMSAHVLVHSGVAARHDSLSQAVDGLLAHGRLVRMGVANDCHGRHGAAPQRVHTGTATVAGRQSVDIAAMARVLQAINVACQRPGRDGDALPPGIHVAAVHRVAARADAAVRHDQRDTLCVDAAACLVDWLWQCQGRDGGWSPLMVAPYPASQNERRRDRRWNHVPSEPDVTGIVLDALGCWGFNQKNPAVHRAVRFLRASQQADGSWDSRTGVRFVHGTSAAVCGLIAVGAERDDEAVAAGVNWLLSQQQHTGGWGESAETIVDRRGRTQETATATQTAWALLALLAAGEQEHDAVARGIRFLLETQEEDGDWDEPHFTLRSCHGALLYRNELCSVCFPLLAMSRWAVAIGRVLDRAGPVQLRLVDATGRSHDCHTQ